MQSKRIKPEEAKPAAGQHISPPGAIWPPAAEESPPGGLSDDGHTLTVHGTAMPPGARTPDKHLSLLGSPAIDPPTAKKATGAFIDAFAAENAGDFDALRDALTRLLMLGEDGAALHAIYVNTDDRERARIHHALQYVFNRSVDINLPKYQNLSQFVTDLLKLNPVPERKPAPTHAPAEAERRTHHLDALLATVPKDAPFDVKAEKLGEVNHEVRQRIAAELAPALNARIREMPHETYEEKKALAGWVNDQLEPLGLAVQEPKTGLPAKLRGIPGNWPGVGRFALEIYSDGKRKNPTVSDQLPELTLMDATPPEPEKGWQQAVGPKASRAGRRR